MLLFLIVVAVISPIWFLLHKIGCRGGLLAGVLSSVATYSVIGLSLGGGVAANDPYMIAIAIFMSLFGGVFGCATWRAAYEKTEASLTDRLLSDIRFAEVRPTL